MHRISGPEPMISVTDARSVRRERPRPLANALVSVIVPVRDDGAGVREVVRRLQQQTLPRERVEIVVGDDGSEPGSLAGVASEDGRVRVVSGPPRTSYAARNRAAASVRGAVLAFCDSDCLPEPTWLEEGLAVLEDADVVAGEVLFLPPPEPTVWSLLSIDMFLDQERNVLLGRGVTANLFVRRALFERLGGFDPTLPSGGDYDFVRRAVDDGGTLAYSPDAIVRHPTIDERRAFLRKVWTTNRWSAVRKARAGEPPDRIGALSAFVPVFGVARARRHALRRPFGLERSRLERSGVVPRPLRDARALLALYLGVAYVAGTARTVGWAQGRRLAREAPLPETVSDAG